MSLNPETPAQPKKQYRLRTDTHAGQTVGIGSQMVVFDPDGISEPVGAAVLAGIEGVGGFYHYETIGETPPIPPLPPVAPIRISVVSKAGDPLGEAELRGTLATLLVDLPVPAAPKEPDSPGTGKAASATGSPAPPASSPPDPSAATSAKGNKTASGKAGKKDTADTSADPKTPPAENASGAESPESPDPEATAAAQSNTTVDMDDPEDDTEPLPIPGEGAN